MKKQWEKRVEISNYFYQCLLLDYSPQTIVNEAFEQCDFDVDQMKVIEYLAQNYVMMIEEIIPFIQSTWTWDRISFVDRAIMLTAIAEVRAINTPKTIAIDQALISAKQFNIDDTYKYINAILEKVIKSA